MMEPSILVRLRIHRGFTINSAFFRGIMGTVIPGNPEKRGFEMAGTQRAGWFVENVNFKRMIWGYPNDLENLYAIHRKLDFCWC